MFRSNQTCRLRTWRFFYSTAFLLTASFLLLLALAGEPHLAVVLLVVQHVHQVIEQLPAVPTNKDVRITFVKKIQYLIKI